MRTISKHNLAAIAAAALAVVALGGCGDGKAAAAPGAGTIDGALAGFRAAGLTPGEFAPTDGHALGAEECRTGLVSGLETTLCHYPSEAAARAAQPGGLARVGEATGSALSSGPLLLVVADRNRSDHDGKLINRLTKSFLQKPAAQPESGKH